MARRPTTLVTYLTSGDEHAIVEDIELVNVHYREVFGSWLLIGWEMGEGLGKEGRKIGIPKHRVISRQGCKGRLRRKVRGVA